MLKLAIGEATILWRRANELTPRVKFAVGIFQSLGADMCIDLRRGDIGMSKEFLDHS